MTHHLVAVSALSIVAGLLSQESKAQDNYGEVALSDDSIQLRYAVPSSASAVGSEPSELGFGLFLNENRDIVANADYYVEARRLRFNRLTFKAGPVAYAAMLNTENTDVFGIAVGAEVRFEFLRRQGLDVVGKVAYAPDILTFGAADKVWDVIGRVELPLAENMVGFAGYRLFEIDLLEGTQEIEESLHLGLRYLF
ncbi:MAG: hypothetical protein ACREQ8_11595 [Woeseiaceae bacterium]